MSKIFPTDYPLDNSLRMHSDGVDVYWFYHKNTLIDEPLLYSDIISRATSSVEIWEPYFNVTNPNKDHEILNSISANVTIKILTKKGIAKNSTYLSDIHNAIKQILPASMNLRLGIRVIDRGDSNNFGFLFHDRFLIIDRRDVYSIGGSVGWHISSIESTGILNIENEDTKIFIQCLFDEYWRKGVTNELPIQFLHL